MEKKKISTPFVSVIVPVLNNADGIKRCVIALTEQTYSSDAFEIIVIDNGSDDNTPEVISGLPVRFLKEHRTKSPYPARNRGLEAAKGEIVAFTDSRCIPDEKWIENAVTRMAEEQADLLGGEVRFDYSDLYSAAERYDSLINLEVKNNIAAKGVAKTCNLFVRKELFNTVGLFREDVRSGGDVEWTGRATERGYRIVYGPDVVVNYEARGLSSLLQKMYRVGKGQPATWRKENGGRKQMLMRIMYDLRPMLPGFIHDQIKFRGQKNVPVSILSLMLVGWSCRLANGAGRFIGLININD